MSTDSAVTYTSVHSEVRSWSTPSEDPYEEAARQLLGENHVLQMPAEDEAPTPLLPPSFLSPRIRPISPRALELLRAMIDGIKERETAYAMRVWRTPGIVGLTDDLAVQHIMRTQALEARARVDTLEDTGSSS
ncbi:hypothetical protein Tco_0120980 [Tanacetum coccineum]